MIENLEKRDYGKEFEEEVRVFLEETLRLTHVKGGQDFHIAAPGQKNQIDACGRYGDVLFVFECKASGRKTKKNLRQDILATRERARIALENYKYVPEYATCSYIRFIFITKKIEIPDTEKELFKNLTHPELFYADENLLEYYTDLHEKIGEYALFNFLSDFKIRPPEEDCLEVLATKVRLGDKVIYSFFSDPKKLLKFSYVARRRSLKENFYQRMLDKGRIKRIQKFLDDGGIFPTNIILSFRGGEIYFQNVKSFGLDNKQEVGRLIIKGSYNACWIIDGQHRLYSFARSKSEGLVSCIAFSSIEIEDERRYFLEINREQRPIQPDLIWDLEGLANPETDRGIISNIVRTLNYREPFLGKIYIPVKGTKVDKLVNMAAFCNGIYNASLIKRVTSNCQGIENPLFSEDPKTITKRISDVIERFFDALSKDISGDHFSFVFGNAGIPIMLYLLEPIVTYFERVPRGSEFDPFTRYISAFFAANYSSLDEIKKLKADSNSEGSRRNIAKQIGLYIRKELKDDNFWPKMEQDDFVSEIINMERRLAVLIANKLSEITTGWERQRIPQVIYASANKKMDRDGTRFDENLDLGDELQIIVQKNNWDEVFSDIFIKKDRFVNTDELKLAFNYLSKVRNPAAHGKSTLISKQDLSQCAIYLEKFSKSVPELI